MTCERSVRRSRWLRRNRRAHWMKRSRTWRIDPRPVRPVFPASHQCWLLNVECWLLSVQIHRVPPLLSATDWGPGETGPYLENRPAGANGSINLRTLPIQRTADSDAGPFHHVKIDLRGLDASVTQQILDGSNVHAILQQMRGKGMPQRMGCGWFG